MATKTWIGAAGGAWNTGTNWNPTGVPDATSNLVINAGSIVGPNGAMSFADMTGTTGSVSGAGSSSIATYAAGSPFIDVPTAGQEFTFNPAFATGAGAGAIAKTGAGTVHFGMNSPAASNTGWTGGLNILAGEVKVSAYVVTSGRLGTGPITMAAGTAINNYDNSVSNNAFTLANTVTVNGSVGLNSIVTAVKGITFSGTFNLPAVTPTLTINNPVTFSGPITGTAGFTKAGTGSLTLTNVTPANNTLQGVVSITGTGALNFGVIGTGVATLNQLPQVSEISNSSTSLTGFFATASAATGTLSPKLSGTGTTWVEPRVSTTGAGITLSGDLSTLGNPASVGTTGTGASTFPATGLSAYTATATNAFYTLSNSLPVQLSYVEDVAAAGRVQNVYFTGTPSVYPTHIRLIAHTARGNVTRSFFANQAGVGVTLSGTVQSAGVTGTLIFTLQGSNPQDNTLSGVISDGVGVLAISKADVGRWVLSGANTYTGNTVVSGSGGTLVAANNSALGTTGAVNVGTVSTLEIAATSVNKSSSAVTVGGTGDGGNGAIRSQSGTNTFTAANYVLTTAGTRVQVDADRLTLASAGAISGALFGIEKTGAGALALTQTNSTYTGATTISAGKLVASKLAIVGAISSLGQPALANATITMAPGTTLAHEGTTADTTDRIIALNAVGTMTIESSGTGVGAVTLSGGSFTLSNGLNTIAFSGINSANNTCARTIADTTSATAVSKSGSNKWVLSGALTHTGTTSCSAGTLNFGDTNRSISSPIAISGGTIENSTNTLATSGGVTMTGGTITAEVASTTAVTVNSGATARLEPTNSANSYTGATAINVGSVLEVVTDVDPEAPAAGKVLGNSAVTVAGTLTTSANANQRGQMRYGGNLTFNSGAILRIGFAA